MNTTVLRFAPSPTGRLHIGNIRTAVLNWLYARQSGGTFILRFDDTDRERSRPEYVDAIRSDLAWLGLEWDREEQQSARSARYDAVAAQLAASGRLYPCYESEDELERRRRLQRARGLPPIYDRAALSLTDADRARNEAEGRRPHWRFRLDNTDGAHGAAPVPTLVDWVDLVRGDQAVDVGSLSDPVLRREDGSYLYTFTSVVDDIDFAVTHIVRGEDHVTNSGVQLQIFDALGAERPRLAHHSLLVDADGSALSKRLGALSIESLRDEGLEPQSVVCHAALVGTSDAIEVHADLAPLIAGFAFDKISRAPGRFDHAELRHLNARLLGSLDHEVVADRLVALGIGAGAAFWDAVRGNCEVLADATTWWRIVDGPVLPVIENDAMTRTAAELLPAEPWDAATWQSWTNALKAATGAKGRALFHPLRLALTGREAGPELARLLPMIGRARAEARLLGRTA